MNQPLTLFQHLGRNLRWYVADIVTAVTGRARPYHFVYGTRTTAINPMSGAPMLGQTRDVYGNRWGTLSRD